MESVSISDKRQITAILWDATNGEFLPPQLIYQGKMVACLQCYRFPDDWHVTCNPNHWSNEEKIKQYIEIIFLLYLERKHKELELPPDQPAWAIFDVLKANKQDKIV